MLRNLFLFLLCANYSLRYFALNFFSFALNVLPAQKIPGTLTLQMSSSQNYFIYSIFPLFIKSVLPSAVALILYIYIPEESPCPLKSTLTE